MTDSHLDKESGADGNCANDGKHQSSNKKRKYSASGINPNEQLDVYIGAVKTDPSAARQFSELVAKTLKLST